MLRREHRLDRQLQHGIALRAGRLAGAVPLLLAPAVTVQEGDRQYDLARLDAVLRAMRVDKCVNGLLGSPPDPLPRVMLPLSHSREPPRNPTCFTRLDRKTIRSPCRDREGT